jgi:predicted phosphodiesterase
MARILHLSDIHFGYRHNHALWEDMVAHASELNPDLVLVTGDVVNTPWRWSLKKAKTQLCAFRGQLRDKLKKPDLRLHLVPGNHDTRYTGLIPIRVHTWFNVLATSGLIIAMIANHLGGRETQLTTPTWIVVALLLLSWAVRMSVTTRLKDYLDDDLLIDDAIPIKALKLGIIAFDSATPIAYSASGKIAQKEFTRCRKVRDNNDLTWIAIVHHHPLPLPYDSQHETMMVMQNAGAFLRELGQYGIGLVLHGHKHHQHFARITVDPARGQTLELAVLSAGTPTEGRASGSWRHGFNIVDVKEDGSSEIEMFEAESGGTFQSVRRFDTRPMLSHRANRFAAEKARLGVSCRESSWSVEFNAAGDATMVHDITGLQTEREPVRSLKNAVVLRTQTGRFDQVYADTYERSGPGLRLDRIIETASDTEPLTSHSIRGDIVFKGDSGLRREHGPVDFFINVTAINAFAMSTDEYAAMYKRDKVEEESLLIKTLPDVALERLSALVRFPAEYGLPPRIDLAVREGESGAFVPLSPDSVTRVRAQNAVLLRVNYPLLGTQYRLSWDLLRDGVEVNESAAHQLAQMRELAARLIAEHAESAQLKLDEIVDWMRADFEELIGAKGNYHVALFAYDQTRESLIHVASNYAEDDARRGWKFRYGDGVIGRAYRRGRPTAFLKSMVRDERSAVLYARGDDQPIKGISDIPESSIIAFPVALVGAESYPFAVLQISTDDPNIFLRTSDSDDEQPLAEFQTALNRLLFVQLDGAFSD